MERPTERVRAALRSGDLKSALALAKGFKLGLTREERAQLGRGWECLVRPDFYEQLGRDPQSEIERARIVLQKWA